MKSNRFFGWWVLFAILLVTLVSAESGLAARNISETFSFGNGVIFKSNFSDDEKAILKLINEERQSRRLNSLNWDASLSKLARAYSNQMARESFFAHRDPNGKNLVGRAKDNNITGWRGIGENLYRCRGYSDPANAAVRGWIKSPAHRANFLSRDWSATGIGVAKSSDGTTYVTQVFLKR